MPSVFFLISCCHAKHCQQQKSKQRICCLSHVDQTFYFSYLTKKEYVDERFLFVKKKTPAGAAIDSRSISLIFAVGPLVLLGRRVGLDLSIHDNQGKETNGAGLVGLAFTCYPTEFPNPVQYSTVYHDNNTQRSRHLLLLFSPSPN